MTEGSDHVSETFRRDFRLREFENVCVLHLAEDFNPDNSDAVSVLSAGVESMLRAGVRGFVFDLTQFSHRVDLEESLGHVVQSMVPVIRNGGVLNWLRGSIFVQEWRVLKLLGLPPDNFETEREAVEGLQAVLKAAEIRTDLAHRIVNSGVSIKHIAKVAGLFESDGRRIAEGVEEPSDRVALLISSTLDSLSIQKRSATEPTGAA